MTELILGESESLDTKNDAHLVIVEQRNQLRELQTILKDRTTTHADFMFYADRLMRTVIEAGLNRLPFEDVTVKTPTGVEYHGITFCRGNCGISLCRSGEAMEIALRQCCRSIRIGKMLIEDGKVLYARLMPDVSRRRVLLLYPTVSNGTTTCKAIEVLKESGVDEKKIFLITLFISPSAMQKIRAVSKEVTVITSEVGPLVPSNFAKKYFGTD